MEKNTILAIVLSTLVLVGFMFFQTTFFPAKNAPENTSNAGSVQTAAPEQVNEAVKPSVQAAVVSEPEKSDEILTEENFTITTDKVRVVFTNRGGDIVSYELLDHLDRDTGKGVELSDNVSNTNRMCALAFGSASNPIINDIFFSKRIDDNTIGFFKTFNIKNSDNTDNVFTIAKTYTFKNGEYAFKLDVTVDGDTGSNGLNFGGASYTIRTSPQLGPHFNRKTDRYESRQFIAYNGDKSKRIVLSDKQFKEYDKGNMSWVGIGGKYFVGLIIPENKSIVKSAYYSSLMEINDYANAQALLVRDAFNGGKINDTYYLYFGPRNEKDLHRYNSPENNAWNLKGQNLGESLQSNGFLSWLETALKWMMEMIYKVVPNWGASIIILTIFLKMIMFPLTKKSSMGTLKMQELQPELQAIQAKYKDNPQKLQAETAKVYKAAGYNPVSGCLPMVFMFVILFAMFNLFNNYFEFRGAMFIPGWIPDLSVGDSIYTFKFTIPFIGNELRLLPIIYVVSQLLFGKITQNGGTMTGSSAAQMKIMMYGMPLFFFFIFYNAPSGLLLYWTVSNFVQLIQQLVINGIMNKKKAALAANGKTAVSGRSSNIKQFPKNKR
ncbi:membrane protein insertase YidC [Treponema parvum]|uniref:Membrane protein insertase YidC n=1 Tax=Treponema parvum TaxID=138851 RepID=A0A975F1L0_9SPIR|nr:membrane protein insertase YidC [Treponema parvum]QTQ12799.1 membrane protein insertase YidC [Treponema parvum]